MGPTLATGKQGWDKLIGRAVAGLPSHRPGKQEEKAAKPPAEKEKRRELVRLPANGFPHGTLGTLQRTHQEHCTAISGADRRSEAFSEVNLGYNVWVPLSATGARKRLSVLLCAS